MQAVLAAILADLFPSKDNKPGLSSHQCLVDAILSAAAFSKDAGSNEKNMSFEDFKNLCDHVPSLRKYLGSLLTAPDPGLWLLRKLFLSCNCVPTHRTCLFMRRKSLDQ